MYCVVILWKIQNSVILLRRISHPFSQRSDRRGGNAIREGLHLLGFVIAAVARLEDLAEEERE
jgi:hypothetical protein